MDDSHARAWGFLDDGIHVTRENAQLYFESAKKVYASTCLSDYDFAEFEKRAIGEFAETAKNGGRPSDEEIFEFFSKLKSEKTLTFLVTRDIRGVRLSNENSSPLNLGPFSIFFYPSHKHFLSSDQRTCSFVREKETTYLLGVNVEAKNATRAIEKADELFEVFEKIVRFMVGPSDRYDVKVLGSYGRYSQNAYVFVDGNPATSSHRWLGPMQDLPIDDKYFCNADLGYDLLWASVNNPSSSSLQARLITASQWIGEAYSERDRAGSFLKSAIALEVLFTANEKAIVNPSILSAISEAVACLLGEEVEDRSTIERKMKRYYGVRSAIAHAGKIDVDQTDLEEFSWLVRRSIIKVMSTPKLRTMGSIEKVHEHIKRLKYSFPAI